MASTRDSASHLQEIHGRFGKVLFRNEETGATIALFHCPGADGSPETDSVFRVRGRFSADDLTAREVTLWGQEREGSRGRFFFVSDGNVWRGISPLQETPTPEAIERFCSEAFRGRRFGPAAAKKLVAALGDGAWAALTRDPYALAAQVGDERGKELFGIVQGITVSRATALAHLLGMGFSWAYARRALATFGSRAVERLRTDPYRIIAASGVQFSTADRIARGGCGVSPTDPRRLRALCVSVLQEAASQGHTSLSEAEVLSQIERLGSLTQAGVDAKTLLDGAVREGSLASDLGDVYLPRLLGAEKQAAESLAHLLMREPRALAHDFQSDPDLSHYNERQREAIEKGLTKPIVLVNGPPGSGKTTVAKEIVRFAQKKGIRITLCATTGNAADRLTESITQPERDGAKIVIEAAQTIQSVVGNQAPGKTLPQGIVVIDEAGMMDLPLFARVLSNAGPNTSLVLLGDPDQIPPVVAGAASRDAKNSSVVSTVELDQVYRQGKHTLIAINGERIRRGLMPVFYGQALYPETLAASGVVAEPHEVEMNAYLREAHDPVVGAAKVVDTVQRFCNQGADPLRDIKVYAPMRRGYMGTHNLNRLLQAFHNPDGEPVRSLASFHFPIVRTSRNNGGRRRSVPARLPLEIGDAVIPASRGKKGGAGAGQRGRLTAHLSGGGIEVEWSPGERVVYSPEEQQGLCAVFDLWLRVGDPVVHLKNDKDRKLVNGMRGVVVQRGEGGGAEVDYDGRRVNYTRAQLKDLAIAYATTVHKGQGQEARFTVLALHHAEHMVMLERGLLLVGLTRAREKAVAVGTTMAFRMSLRKSANAERRTRLAERAATRLEELQRDEGEHSRTGRGLPPAPPSRILQATGTDGAAQEMDPFGIEPPRRPSLSTRARRARSR